MDAVATVGHERVSCDERRSVAEEECDGVGRFGWCTEATKGIRPSTWQAQSGRAEMEAVSSVR